MKIWNIIYFQIYFLRLNQLEREIRNFVKWIGNILEQSEMIILKIIFNTHRAAHKEGRIGVIYEFLPALGLVLNIHTVQFDIFIILVSACECDDGSLRQDRSTSQA